MPNFVTLATGQDCIGVSTDNAGTQRLDSVNFSVGSTGGSVSQIWFVDAANAASATRNGSILDPFGTIQEAVDAFIASTLDDGAVIVAPGDYPGNITIGPSGNVNQFVIQGWLQFNQMQNSPSWLPRISGDIVIHDSIPVSLGNALFSGAISSPAPATDDLEVKFFNARILGDISGATVNVEFEDSYLTAFTCTGNTVLVAKFDAYSWSSAAQNATDFVQVGGTYTRQFRGVGADEQRGLAINLAGMAVGETRAVHLAAPGARAGDYAFLTLNPVDTACDYTISFLYCDTDQAVFNWTNLSRNPGDFTETANVAIMHGQMPEVPVP